jgi:hypothetical protein
MHRSLFQYIEIIQPDISSLKVGSYINSPLFSKLRMHAAFDGGEAALSLVTHAIVTHSLSVTSVTFVLGKPHTSILSMRNVIWTFLWRPPPPPPPPPTHLETSHIVILLLYRLLYLLFIMLLPHTRPHYLPVEDSIVLHTDNLFCSFIHIDNMILAKNLCKSFKGMAP